MDHRNFDDTSGVVGSLDKWRYDRRHVCTFYSFDRNLAAGLYSKSGLYSRLILADAANTLTSSQRAMAARIFVPLGAATTNIETPLSADPPYNNIETRQKIVHLLYAFRGYFMERYPTENYMQAARRAAQVVANIIDFSDDTSTSTEGPFFNGSFIETIQPPLSETYTLDYLGQRNADPTFLNRAIIREMIREMSIEYRRTDNTFPIIDIDDPAYAAYDFELGIDDPDETVYGYERQPFISEIHCDFDNDAGGVRRFAVELCNPYDGIIYLDGWRITAGSSVYTFTVADDALVDVATSSASADLGRFVITSHDLVPPPPTSTTVLGFGVLRKIGPSDIITLQRPDPANAGKFITVDTTEVAQTTHLIGSGNGLRVAARDDSQWRFADAGSYDTVTNVSTLGLENNATVSNPNGHQMPVPDNNVAVATLGDFEKILFAGNSGDDANAVTIHIASASTESDVHFNIKSQQNMLKYISFINRPEGTLPGRININTATEEVIRAAIPPNDAWDPDPNALAANIVAYRVSPSGPFKKIDDLLDVPGFQQFTDASINVGDVEMIGDFEERDWILSRVANIFTVRSDVFTAYILVRLGQDGPQKRMIAIFNRSNVLSPNDKPRLIALHPVPDPR